MSSPSSRDVHVNAALSQWAADYENGNYLADLIMPPTLVDKRSDVYYTFSREDYTTVLDDELGPDSEANETGYSQGTANYSVRDHGLKRFVPDAVQANADAPLNPEQDATDILMNRLMLNREVRCAAVMNATGNYNAANTSAAANAWSDYTDGDPIGDVHTMKEALPPAPNKSKSILRLVLTEAKWHDLRAHPALRGGGESLPVVDEAKAASILQVDEILVSDADRNTAAPGLTPVYASIWTDTNAILTRVPRGTPSGKQSGIFGITFRWKATGSGMLVRDWRVEGRGVMGGTMVQASFSDDENVVQDDMAYLMTGV
ncbi:MAG: hypothetical protein OER92_04905 [Alphaproteobacteria bacterium]|nr:hypothetical protein [Alphaproteobacteria bacterium]